MAVAGKDAPPPCLRARTLAKRACCRPRLSPHSLHFVGPPKHRASWMRGGARRSRHLSLHLPHLSPRACALATAPTSHRALPAACRARNEGTDCCIPALCPAGWALNTARTHPAPRRLPLLSQPLETHAIPHLPASAFGAARRDLITPCLPPQFCTTYFTAACPQPRELGILAHSSSSRTNRLPSYLSGAWRMARGAAAPPFA